jgi:signal transduction histidine kinase
MQVLINLLSNAIKYTDYGQITLESRLGAESILLIVTDTGVGMTAAQMSQLF